MTNSSGTEAAGASTDYVQSLARGLSVIKAFDAENPRRTLSDVARATDLTRATARRFLLTLAELGYVRTDGSAFWLTPRVLELGYSYLSSLSLPDIAGPHLEALSDRVHESTSVSILDDGDVVYVARVPVRRIMTVSSRSAPASRVRDVDGTRAVGRFEPRGAGRLPRPRGSDPITGRTIATPAALRDELDKIRVDGFCVVDQELEEGLRSLAAPIRDRDGTVVAAVNISTQAARYTTEAVYDTLVPAAVATADAISADLARTQTQSPSHQGTRYA